MSKIHLIEGPIGAGKSTYAKNLGQRLPAPVMMLDQWFASLFGAEATGSSDMAWYLERKARCISCIWEAALDLLRCDIEVVLELGLIRASDRQDFYQLQSATPYDLTVHWLDAPVAVRRERVALRNVLQGSTYAMDVTDEVFDRANSFWEPPSETELAEKQCHFIDTTPAV